MAVGNDPSFQWVDGNGSTTVFDIPFRFLDNADLAFLLEDAQGNQTSATPTVITGAANENGGQFTLATAPAVGERIGVFLEMDLGQPTDISGQEDVPLEAIELAIDRQAMLIIQQQSEIDRSLRVSLADTTDVEAGYLLPIDRANKFLSFDGNKQPVAVEVQTASSVVIGPGGVQPYDADTAFTDAAQNFTAPQRSPFVAANDGAIDFDAGQNFKITPQAPAGALNVTFTNLADGQGGTIVIDNTAGNATSFVWGTGAQWGDIGAPSIGSERVRIGYMVQGTSVDLVKW